MKSLVHKNVTLALTLIFLGGSGTVLAHHPMSGDTPTTVWQGLLSGLGHPIIGIDHLAFIAPVGLLCAFARLRSLGLPLALVGATVLGAVLQWSGFTLAYTELMVAGSVIAAGLMLYHAPARLDATRLVFALAAVCHGLAYGEAIIGAEPAPLNAYLVGFSLVQMMIAGLAFVAGGALLNLNLKVLQITRNISAALVGGIGLLTLSTAVPT